MKKDSINNTQGVSLTIEEREMNSVNLIGRLTDQPTLRYSQGGAAVSNFRAIAVNGKKKQGQPVGWMNVDYFDCTLFGNQAEKLQQYLGKGKQVGISGRLKQQRWQDNGTEPQ